MRRIPWFRRGTAMDDRFLDPEPCPDDPVIALARARQDLSDRGYRLVGKPSIARPEWLRRWNRYTTTLPGVDHHHFETPELILLGEGFDRKPVERQAATLRHELVHVRQAEQMGAVLFGLRYSWAGWRWALEVQAYREDVRTMRAFGVSRGGVRIWCSQRARSISAIYRLGHLKAVERETEVALIRELRRT